MALIIVMKVLKMLCLNQDSLQSETDSEYKFMSGYLELTQEYS